MSTVHVDLTQYILYSADMSFVLEVKKNGKDIILYNDNKFRESYQIKCGDVVWRCLGKTCKAFIRTNEEKTAIFSSNESHSGQHPVTMRALTPTPSLQRKRPPPPRPVTPAAESDPSPPTSTPLAISTTPLSGVSATTGLPQETSEAVYTPIDEEQSSDTLSMNILLLENKKLKDQVQSLNQRLKDVLDHSIVSDTRLMQYTDQVFVTNSYLAGETRRAGARECAVQRDLPVTCQDERCADTRSLVTSLKTTIEVLEAELELMRGEKKRGNEEENNREWTTVMKLRNPVATYNRYETLKQPQVHTNYVAKNSVHNVKINLAKKRKKMPTNPLTTGGRVASNTHKPTKEVTAEGEVLFPFVSILSDSHGRHIASLVQNLVSTKTKVTCICKPGAKLMNIAPNSPPSGGCTIIIAGSNDVAAGEQGNIYRYLSQKVTNYLRTTKVVVATLPHRHDLAADHPINQQTVLANRYIRQVCEEHQGAVLLDFNRISRRFFTRNGMHLRMLGKRMLARLIVERVGSASETTSTAIPPRPSRVSLTEVTCQQPSAHPLSSAPYVMSFDTYAEAARSQKTVIPVGNCAEEKNCIVVSNVRPG